VECEATGGDECALPSIHSLWHTQADEEREEKRLHAQKMAGKQQLVLGSEKGKKKS
jgi:hypothetical protein